MESVRKTSTDPQENEIDSNYLGGIFRVLFDSEGDQQERREHHLHRPDEEKTVDEKQDPACDKW